jgi:hypothetical protein
MINDGRRCLIEGRLTYVLIASMAMVVLAVTAGRAADLLVVEARGVALRPGAVIDDTQTLVLREGQRVTLLAANGNTLLLRGPYDQAPTVNAAAIEMDVSQALKALIAKSQSRTSDVGVIRAGGVRAKLPEPWVIDVTRPGTVCVREGDPVVFWRPSSNSEVALSVTPLDRSWKLLRTWPSGTDRLIMPSSVVVHNKSTYLVELDAIQAAVTLSGIPSAVHTDVMRAAWMIEKGCQAQAEALLAVLR